VDRWAASPVVDGGGGVSAGGEISDRGAGPDTHGGLIYSSVNPAVFDRIPSTARSVLDIGCGDGTLGRALKQRAACEVTGVTFSAEEARRAAEVIDRVQCVDLESADLSALGSFDAVVCSHVLEHLRDPRRLLVRLRANVAPEGLLVVALPNPMFWRQRLAFTAGRFRYTKGGLMDDTHLRFFDWVTARELVESAGFRIIDAMADGGWPGSRFVPRVLGQTLDRLATSARPGLFGTQFVFRARPANAGAPAAP
jgi:SAM-dependent methyltransferase